MIVYLFIWFLLAASSIMDLIYKRLYDKRVLNLFLCILLALFVGLRFECDNDYSTYVGHWDHLPVLYGDNIEYIYNKFSADRLEVGYKFIAIILKSIGLSPQSMFLFCSTLTFSLFYRITPYYTRYPNIALLIFFSQFIMLPFMQIRFGVCIMLIWFSFLKWTHNEKWKAVLVYICAISFHNLAFGVLALLPLVKLKLKYLYCILAVTLIIPLNFVSNLSLAIVYLMGWDYTGYFDSTDSLSYISYALNFVLILPIIIISGFRSFTIKETTLLKFYIISLIVFSLAINISILARIAITFSISICFILPDYMRLIRNETRYTIVILLGLIIYCALKYFPALKYFNAYNYNLKLL